MTGSPHPEATRPPLHDVAHLGHVELLTPTQLSAIADLAAKTRAARDMVDEFRIWMLYPGNRSVNRILLRRPHVQLITRTKKEVIALNGRGAGG